MRPLLKNTKGNYNKEEKQEEDNLGLTTFSKANFLLLT